MRIMYYKAYALMAILVASVTLLGSNAYAQAGMLTVETDKAEYAGAETIVISGEVGTIKDGQPVLLQVFNPNGVAYRIDQFEEAADGSYTYDLVVGGPIGITGEYNVKVFYNKRSAETTFMYTSAEGPGPPMKTYNLIIANQTYVIEYSITGGRLNSISADVPFSTLTVDITSTRDGTFTIVLPRNVIQSLEVAGVATDGADVEYVVFADEAGEAIFDETENTDESRTLAIDFEAGTEQLEIVGTWVVPEFGQIAAIILAVSIVGIIVATARHQKFSFLPKQ